MSERAAGLLVALVLSATPAAAEPAVTILDLPFAARALRGPGSAVAVAVATSGLLRPARPAEGASRGADPKAAAAGDLDDAPVAVVWGEGGGAALTLKDGRIETTLLGAQAIEGIVAAETPRGALPGSRGVTLGPVSAYLAPGEAGTVLALRERRPVAVSAQPTAVPIAMHTVSAGPGAGFGPGRPHAARADGDPVVFAVAGQGPGSAMLAALGKTGSDKGSPVWAVLGRTPPEAGGPLDIAAVGAFAGPGTMRIATILAPDRGGRLKVWTWDKGAFALAGEADGYTDRGEGAAEADFATAIEPRSGAVPDLALSTADRDALAILSLKEGIRERARIVLPAKAGFGLAALGRGAQARLVVGLADGRVAVVTP